MPRVIWTPYARGDLQAVHEFIARDSKRTADSFVQRLIRTVNALRSHPRLGAVVPEIKQKMYER